MFNSKQMRETLRCGSEYNCSFISTSCFRLVKWYKPPARLLEKWKTSLIMRLWRGGSDEDAALALTFFKHHPGAGVSFVGGADRWLVVELWLVRWGSLLLFCREARFHFHCKSSRGDVASTNGVDVQVQSPVPLSHLISLQKPTSPFSPLNHLNTFRHHPCFFLFLFHAHLFQSHTTFSTNISCPFPLTTFVKIPQLEDRSTFFLQRDVLHHARYGLRSCGHRCPRSCRSCFVIVSPHLHQLASRSDSIQRWCYRLCCCSQRHHDLLVVGAVDHHRTRRANQHSLYWSPRAICLGAPRTSTFLCWTLLDCCNKPRRCYSHLLCHRRVYRLLEQSNTSCHRTCYLFDQCGDLDSRAGSPYFYRPPRTYSCHCRRHHRLYHSTRHCHRYPLRSKFRPLDRNCSNLYIDWTGRMEWNCCALQPWTYRFIWCSPLFYLDGETCHFIRPRCPVWVRWCFGWC